MASKKRALRSGKASGADDGPATKKRKSYRHFKESWKSKAFAVLVGDTWNLSLSGNVITGRDGGDAATGLFLQAIPIATVHSRK